jgi:hypothetical protein
MKDQAQALIPSELQDKSEDNPEQKDSKNDKNKKVPKKPKKKSPITRALVLKMYSILFFHTLLITILLFVFEKSDKEFDLLTLIIFLGCFAGGFFLSLSVSNMKCLSKGFMNYIIYIILLAANIIAFLCCSRLDTSLFEITNTIFIIFDAGSLTIILFASLVKDTPSTFWLMLSCSGGLIIAIFVMIKIYYSGKLYRLLLLFVGCLSFGVYESMNSNALNADIDKITKEPSPPSLVSLPFELNVCFIKVFWYIIKGIYTLCTLCCSLCPKKRRRR